MQLPEQISEGHGTAGARSVAATIYAALTWESSCPMMDSSLFRTCAFSSAPIDL